MRGKGLWKGGLRGFSSCCGVLFQNGLAESPGCPISMRSFFTPPFSTLVMNSTGRSCVILVCDWDFIFWPAQCAACCGRVIVSDAWILRVHSQLYDSLILTWNHAAGPHLQGFLSFSAQVWLQHTAPSRLSRHPSARERRSAVGGAFSSAFYRSTRALLPPFACV